VSIQGQQGGGSGTGEGRAERGGEAVEGEVQQLVAHIDD